MSRQWYLSRDGKVFGPVNDAQLAKAVAAGRILPTDQLNVAGLSEWRVATAVPGLLPAVAAETDNEVATDIAEVVDAPVAAPVKLRVTCMACFRVVSVRVVPGATETHCPKCRSAIMLGAPSEPAPAPATSQSAFAKLETKRDFKERMHRKDPTARARKRDRED